MSSDNISSKLRVIERVVGRIDKCIARELKTLACNFQAESSALMRAMHLLRIALKLSDQIAILCIETFKDIVATNILEGDSILVEQVPLTSPIFGSTVSSMIVSLCAELVEGRNPLAVQCKSLDLLACVVQNSKLNVTGSLLICSIQVAFNTQHRTANDDFRLYAMDVLSALLIHVPNMLEVQVGQECIEKSAIWTELLEKRDPICRLGGNVLFLQSYHAPCETDFEGALSVLSRKERDAFAVIAGLCSIVKGSSCCELLRTAAGRNDQEKAKAVALYGLRVVLHHGRYSIPKLSTLLVRCLPFIFDVVYKSFAASRRTKLFDDAVSIVEILVTNYMCHARREISELLLLLRLILLSPLTLYHQRTRILQSLARIMSDSNLWLTMYMSYDCQLNHDDICILLLDSIAQVAQHRWTTIIGISNAQQHIQVELALKCYENGFAGLKSYLMNKDEAMKQSFIKGPSWLALGEKRFRHERSRSEHNCSSNSWNVHSEFHFVEENLVTLPATSAAGNSNLCPVMEEGMDQLLISTEDTLGKWIQHKLLLSRAVRLLNTELTRGLRALRKCGIIQSESDSSGFCLALRHLRNVSPSVLRTVLSKVKKSSLYANVARLYMHSLRLKDVAPDEAVRQFTELFPMTAHTTQFEGPVWFELMGFLAEAYTTQNPGLQLDRESGQILCSTLLTLHTTHHNPNIHESERFTAERFSSATLECLGANTRIGKEQLMESFRRVTRSKWKPKTMPANMTDYEWECFGYMDREAQFRNSLHRRHGDPYTTSVEIAEKRYTSMIEKSWHHASERLQRDKEFILCPFLRPTKPGEAIHLFSEMLNRYWFTLSQLRDSEFFFKYPRVVQRASHLLGTCTDIVAILGLDLEDLLQGSSVAPVESFHDDPIRYTSALGVLPWSGVHFQCPLI